ncbi:hypothetical protein V6N12_035650 [Hibiscus sabdariffa]|uniref:Uncharacterized protein n=1 Tax=Hibiscus sabdariffa TaxID=183260 RepID=A0ABR2END1_9ROSI
MEVVLPNLPAATAPLVPPIPNPSSLSVVSDLGDVAPLLSNSLANPPTPPSTKPFGPWMMVERRMCHNYRKAFTTTQNETISEVKGSRFNLIFEEDAMAIPTIITNATNSIDARDVGKMPIESSKVTRDASKMYVVVTRSKHPSASTAVKSLAKSTVTHHREMIIDAPRPAKSQVTPSIHKPIFVQNQYATSSVKHARRASHLSASRFAHFNRRDPAIDKRKHIMQLWSIRIVIQILFSKHLPVALLLLRVVRLPLTWWLITSRKAKIHQSRNKVSSLRLLDDAWCEDENSLRDTAAIYFRNLYFDEVIAALMDMVPLKAPGPDGLHAEFFQRQWFVVGLDICRAIQSVFQGGDLELSLNRATIVLLPKVNVP